MVNSDLDAYACKFPKWAISANCGSRSVNLSTLYPVIDANRPLLPSVRNFRFDSERDISWSGWSDCSWSGAGAAVIEIEALLLTVKLLV